MQIQRIQTLFLLIAVVLMAVFCFTPFAETALGDGSMNKVFAKDAPVLLIVNACIAVLLFVNIFMYKNLRQQMRVTLLSIMLMVCSTATCLIVATTGMPDTQLIWTGGVVLVVIALVCAIAAYRYMLRDKRKLASYDRLR